MVTDTFIYTNLLRICHFIDKSNLTIHEKHTVVGNVYMRLKKKFPIIEDWTPLKAYAFKAIKNELRNHHRTSIGYNRHMIKVQVNSEPNEELIVERFSNTIEEYKPDAQLLHKMLLDALENDKQRQVAQYLIDGYNLIEISKMMNLTTERVRQIRLIIRKIIKKNLNFQEK